MKVKKRDQRRFESVFRLPSLFNIHLSSTDLQAAAAVQHLHRAPSKRLPSLAGAVGVTHTGSDTKKRGSGSSRDRRQLRSDAPAGVPGSS